MKVRRSGITARLAGILAAIAAAAALLDCGQEKTAVGGGNAFHFEMDVSPEEGNVGTLFQYEVDIDIIWDGATLEDLRAWVRVPKSLRLVKALGVGATLNGIPIFIADEDEQDDVIVYSFSLGDVSEDPSAFRFQCMGIEEANDQFVFVTMQADGTTAPTVSRQVDIN